MFKHITVMKNEVVEELNVCKGCKYIDCTFGNGGHSFEIIKDGGIVLGIDVDEKAIEIAYKVFYKYIRSNKLIISRNNFKYLDKVVKDVGWGDEKISGVIYDLGVSTFQIKESKLGFSFQDDTEMDMRMDRSIKIKAIDLIKGLGERELAYIFNLYGNEIQAKRYAKAIKSYVKNNDDVMAIDIANVVMKNSRYKYSKVHPATRVFQALRIVVNDELNCLKISLEKVAKMIKKNGKILVICFHSLEERIVKETMKYCDVVYIKKIKPSMKEIYTNRSARSASLIVYKKI